jgi:hypothetical protein
MTRDELITLHQTLCSESRALMQKKNVDYGGATADPFFNFRRAEMLGICSAQDGILTRMCDKLARLISYSKNGTLAVSNEGVRDTCIDLMNYAVIFAGYCEQKAEKQ